MERVLKSPYQQTSKYQIVNDKSESILPLVRNQLKMTFIGQISSASHGTTYYISNSNIIEIKRWRQAHIKLKQKNVHIEEKILQIKQSGLQTQITFKELQLNIQEQW